jgi:hypothetical protein
MVQWIDQLIWNHPYSQYCEGLKFFGLDPKHQNRCFTIRYLHQLFNYHRVSFVHLKFFRKLFIHLIL